MNALILTEPLKALEPFQFFVFAFENNLCGSFFRGFCIENIHKRFFSGINSDGCLKRVWKLLAWMEARFSRAPDLFVFLVNPVKNAVRLNLGKSRGERSSGDFQSNKAISTAVPNERFACVSVYGSAPIKLVLFSELKKKIQHFYEHCSNETFPSLLLSMIKFCLAPLFSHRLEKAPSQVKAMTTKENLFEILNAVGGLIFLTVLVTVCLAMAAAPVAVFIWLVYLMLKFLGVFA